jgi:nitrogen-specific signal transduction histidine kinase/CheY-like chemotaxis protein
VIGMRYRCICCTRDPDTRRRLKGWLESRYSLVCVEDAEALSLLLKSDARAVILVDTRMARAMEVVQWMINERPACIAICFAAARSSSALEAERCGVFEILPFEVERKALQSAVQRAVEFCGFKADNAILQNHSATTVSRQDGTGDGRWSEISAELSRTVQCLEEPDKVFARLVQGLSQFLGCARIGLFLESDVPGVYQLHASTGLRSINPTIPAGSPFLQWIKSSGRVAARSTLARIKAKAERTSVSLALDEFAADAIAPLCGTNGGIIGWITAAECLSGEFGASELRNLMRLSQEISLPVERAHACRRAGIREKIVQIAVDAVALGIIVVDNSSRIVWLNQAGERLLDADCQSALGTKLGSLNPNLGAKLKAFHADMSMSRGMLQRESNNSLEFEMRSVEDAPDDLLKNGALILLRDASIEEELEDQRELTFRQELLSEMAQSVAFEIRSPLATIRTFTQLLPERMADVTFAQRYSKFVGHEVDRLSDLSDTVLSFANLKSRTACPSDASFSLERLVELVRCLAGPDWSLVDLQLESGLPALEGNCARLAECLRYLLANAKEATQNEPSDLIRLNISKTAVTKTVPAIEFAVTDKRPIGTTGAVVDYSHLPSPDDQQRAHLRLTFALEIVREFSGDMILSTTDKDVTVRLLIPVS